MARMDIVLLFRVKILMLVPFVFAELVYTVRLLEKHGGTVSIGVT